MLSSHLLSTVLHSAPDAIVIVDSSGRVVYANQQLFALFGLTEREAVGQSIETLIPERFRGPHVQLRQGYVENVRVRPMGLCRDLFARRKDGTEFPVEVSLSPIRDGEQTLVAAAIRDVSDRRKIQGDLQAALDIADRAMQAKGRFLATASHDLRQPLQTLTLLNGALRRTVHDSAAQEILQHQSHAIDAMARLLNALLDISKLESGAIKPDISDFTVAALFEELRSEFAAVAESKGLELRVEPVNGYVHSDPSLVGQILRNLVSNAIKYTRKGSVALRGLPRSKNVRIEVVDTGVGIAPDQLPLIYEEFYQIGTARGGRPEGYGLGLSIVRRLAALLNLELDVSSESGRGSVFAIELPVSAAGATESNAPRAASRPVAPRTARAPRILLVEDDPAVRDATRMLLTVEGYQVVTAASLGEAADKAKANPDIDLLITDYHLAREDTGDQVVARVREILGATLGAILVTGDTSSMIRNLRLDDRLRVASKPIDADELLRLIDGLIATSVR
jgi:two-component system, sensor histidine kinase